MSHFCILVIGEDPEKQLEPFQENNMGDAPDEYLVFNDRTEEIQKEYEKDAIPLILGQGGDINHQCDEKFRNPKYNYSQPNGPKNSQYVYPKDSVEKEVPAKSLYTFDEYAILTEGYTKDETTGKYGYWENPNAKWDWYQIGGRYSGRLVTKKGSKGKRGERSLLDESGPLPEGTTDQAKLKDIDWDAMTQARREKYAKYWAQYEAELAKGTAPGLAQMITGVSKDDTKESYLAQAEEFSVFAVLKNGEWFERGEMGWWAIVSNEIGAQEWKDKITELMSDLDPNTLLTIIDCHI